MENLAKWNEVCKVASLVIKTAYDSDLEEDLEKIPQTNEKHKFGLNRELILRDRLYKKITASEAKQVKVTALGYGGDFEDINPIIKKYL